VARALVLAAILLGFLNQKLAFDPEPIGHGRADGSFYTQVAQHVASGDGLRTSISLYNQGLRELPAPSTIYPLWPLVLGATGRVIGLSRAAWLVPEFLFFVDLLLLYAIANRLGGALGGSTWLRIRGVPLVDLGHVAVLLFGSNRMFFVHTSVPWTEGLAFALLFGSLLVLHEAARRSSVPWAAAAGALAGLAYLTRSQMLGLPLAIAASLVLVGRAGLRWRLAGAALAGSVAAILPWILFLASFVTHFPPRMLVDFTAYRETPQLPPYPGFVVYASGVERLLDFAGSFVQAFHPTRTETYFRSFGAVVALVPVALALTLGRARRRWARARSRPDPDGVLILATIFAAVSCLLPLHALHETSGTIWRFGHRQGLPMVLGIVLALAALWPRGWAMRTLVIVALASAALLPRQTGPGWVRGSGRVTPTELRMLDWLEDHPEPPLVLTTRARELAAWRGVTGHGIRCDYPASNTRDLLRHLDIDYLILYERERRCAFAQGLPELDLVRRFGQGRQAISLYRSRPARDPGVREGPHQPLGPQPGAPAAAPLSRGPGESPEPAPLE
jgi:hypothetical protein